MPLRRAGSEGKVRVVHVTRLGGGVGWSALGSAIAKLPPSGFIAIDTEFSGIGGDPRLSDSDLNVRYEAVRHLGDSRAVLSLGIAVFHPLADDVRASPVESSDAQEVRYNVSIFEYCMSCQSPWLICSEAGQFLVAHGFDFNRVFTSGIPYTRASTEVIKPAAGSVPNEKSSNSDINQSSSGGPFCWAPMPRGLLWRLGRAGAPLVLHNAWLDLAVLFAAFQGPLPPKLSDFVSLLVDFAPAGYYDTKHLASAVAPMRATFLGYLYAKLLQTSSVSVSSGPGLPQEEFASPEDEDEFKRAQSQSNLARNASSDRVCMMYCLRGHCPKGVRCAMSHDPFLVLEFESSKALPDIKEARKMHAAHHKALKKRQQEAEAKAETSEEKKKSKKKRKKESGKKLRAQQADMEILKTGESLLADDEPAESAGKPCNGHEVAGADDVRGSHSKDVHAAHSSGWDAYMTGYSFAALRAKLPPENLARERNKVSMSRKKNALFLSKSRFAELNADPPSSSGDDGGLAGMHAVLGEGKCAKVRTEPEPEES
jgi:target of EGR1 protein 1